MGRGSEGERKAAEFLRKKGYKILAKNFKTRWGEIDIIAQEKKTICFIEVKLRSLENFGLPQEAVSVHKQKKIVFTALDYLKQKNLCKLPCRFDVVAITGLGQNQKIELIKNAFDYDADVTGIYL